MAAMLEQQMKWETYMNRQQQGFAVSNGLLALVEQLSGMPGRKTVVLFSEGFEVPDNVRQEVQRSGGPRQPPQRDLLHHGRGRPAGAQPDAPDRGRRREAGEQNFASGIASDPTGERTEMMWRDPTAGLEPLARHTGGLYIGDTNNLKEGFAKVTADRRFHYLLAYASSNPALDGTYRKIDVRVRRPGREGPGTGRLRGLAVRSRRPRAATTSRLPRPCSTPRRRPPPFRSSSAPSARRSTASQG